MSPLQAAFDNVLFYPSLLLFIFSLNNLQCKNWRQRFILRPRQAFQRRGIAAKLFSQKRAPAQTSRKEMSGRKKMAQQWSFAAFPPINPPLGQSIRTWEEAGWSVFWFIFLIEKLRRNTKILAIVHHNLSLLLFMGLTWAAPNSVVDDGVWMLIWDVLH